MLGYVLSKRYWISNILSGGWEGGVYWRRMFLLSNLSLFQWCWSKIHCDFPTLKKMTIHISAVELICNFALKRRRNNVVINTCDLQDIAYLVR